MNDFSALQIINLQIEKINSDDKSKEDMAFELAILKSFIINQNLLPEMEEFRNLIFMEIDKF
jgi:hypothetical protein